MTDRQIITPPKKIISDKEISGDEKNRLKSKRERNSNLELYRIIAMLLIMAHHYVVNSGLQNILQEAPLTLSSSVMVLLGAWGKAGINCFLFITGFFMCKSSFSWEKLLKLYFQVAFYSVSIYLIFCLAGLEQFGVLSVLYRFWPIKGGFAQNFTACFLMFYLFIPFLNIWIKSLDKRNHRNLCILILLFYALIPSLPKINIEFNYVSWFMGIYLLAAYIRMYGLFPKVSHNQWGMISIAVIMVATLSIVGLDMIYKTDLFQFWMPYYFMFDCNKIIPVLIAVSTFMWFKDLKISQSKIINVLGASTFGVLLIHANSNTMRNWLWGDVVDCVGHFDASSSLSVLYALSAIAVIFLSCACIEIIRKYSLEKGIMQTFRRGNAAILKLKGLYK